MGTTSLLAKIVANAIWQEGRRHEWWPFTSRGEFDEYRTKNPFRLPGNGTHVLVGLGATQPLIVKEIQAITDATCVTTDAFVLPYSLLHERVVDELVS
jgi:hypothetical protein